MPSSDLREFLQQLETSNELRRVPAVDWNMEIGTIAELVNEREGPALLFDELKDYPAGYRVTCGLISTPRRLALALGLDTELSPIEVARRLKDLFRTLDAVEPVRVENGPVIENLMAGQHVDLN